MPANMTYNTLVSDALGYAERTNDVALTAQMPRLVMLAENRVATDLKTKGVLKVVTGQFAVDDPTLPKPAYWRDTVSFQITGADGKRFNLFPRSYEYCANFWPNLSLSGVPRFYADYDFDHFFVVPTPQQAYNFQLSYHARLDPLDTSHQTNWITANAPQLLLQSLMVEVQLYLKNDPTMWAGMYNDALQGLGKENAGRPNDATTLPSS